MPKVLVAASLAFVSVWLALAPSETDAAYTVTVYVHPPAAEDLYGRQPLTCGWHWNCADGSWPDSTPTGTDWDDLYGTTSYFRAFAYSPHGSFTRVGSWASGNWDRPCNGTRVTVRRLDGRDAGYIDLWHTNYSTQSGGVWGLWSGAANVYPVASTGSDWCISTGYHTHQRFAAGAYATQYGKNTTQIANEPWPSTTQLMGKWLVWTWWFNYTNP